MKCKFCKVVFDPKENASIGEADGDAVEVTTYCTNCHEKYYTFTDAEHWASLREAGALIQSIKKGAKR